MELRAESGDFLYVQLYPKEKMEWSICLGTSPSEGDGIIEITLVMTYHRHCSLIEGPRDPASLLRFLKLALRVENTIESEGSPHSINSPWCDS
jgi:hypothetical protein